MTAYQLWGGMLIAVAVLTIGLQVRRLRQGRITRMQMLAGLIARLGFIFLGLVYVTGIVDTHRRIPIVGLALVGCGVALNLVAGIVENIRRSRAPAHVDEP